MVHHRAHTVGANQFTAVGPPTMGPLRPITLRHIIIMGLGTITVRDGATIVPGDGSSQQGASSPRLRPSRIVEGSPAFDRGNQGGCAHGASAKQERPHERCVAAKAIAGTGSLCDLCCPRGGLNSYNLRMAGSRADGCTQALPGL